MFFCTMLNAFENKVLDFIRSQGLLNGHRAILAAVSGGADSMALLAVLKRLAEARAIDATLVVGHVNHCLRGAASDGDEVFVKEAAARWGFDCRTRSVNVRQRAQDERLSIETAARQLRLNALIEMAAESQCSTIATAHHMDDNAETVIHRLLRGTGFRGLAGIHPKRMLESTAGAGAAEFISPLLCVTREEILAYCMENGIEWRHDHTNDQCDHTRNRIRHVLLPEVQKSCDGHVAGEVLRLSQAAGRLVERVERQVDEVWKESVVSLDGTSAAFDRKRLCRLPEIVAVAYARRAIVSIGCGQRDLTERHYQGILRILRGGGRIDLPKGFVVFTDRNRLVFGRQTVSNKCAPSEGRVIDVPGRTPFGDWIVEAALLDASACDIERFKSEKDELVEWFDYDTLALPLMIRKRKVGDRFDPFGMPGEKKVGKFLTAEGISGRAREDIIIVTDSRQIIWVAPVRVSDKTRITPSTTRILQLCLRGVQAAEH